MARLPSGLAALVIATEALWILALGAALGGQRLSWAIAATLLSSLAWSVGVVLGPRLRLPADPLGRAAVATLAGGAMLLLLATLTGEIAALDPGAVSLRSALGLAYLISFGSVVTFAAYTLLLQHVSPTLVATHTFVNPLVAVLVGWMWAGEPLGGTLIVAALAIVAAVVLVQRGEVPGPRVDDAVATVE